MKPMHLILSFTGLAILLAGCQPDASTAGDPRIDGIAVAPPAQPDLSILKDQSHNSPVRYSPSATPSAPEPAPEQSSPGGAPTTAPPAPLPPA